MIIEIGRAIFWQLGYCCHEWQEEFYSCGRRYRRCNRCNTLMAYRIVSGGDKVWIYIPCVVKDLDHAKEIGVI